MVMPMCPSFKGKGQVFSRMKAIKDSDYSDFKDVYVETSGYISVFSCLKPHGHIF